MKLYKHNKKNNFIIGAYIDFKVCDLIKDLSDSYQNVVRKKLDRCCWQHLLWVMRFVLELQNQMKVSKKSCLGLVIIILAVNCIENFRAAAEKLGLISVYA